MKEQIQIRKQKRRQPSTEDLQAEFFEQREREAAERIQRKLSNATRVVEKIDEVCDE